MKHSDWPLVNIGEDEHLKCSDPAGIESLVLGLKTMAESSVSSVQLGKLSFIYFLN